MEKILEKEQIMELYLNEIYLGGGSYGIRSASLNYFNKSLSDSKNLRKWQCWLHCPRLRLLIIHIKMKLRPLKRRNWLVKRLLDENFISIDEYSLAQQSL